MFVLREGCNSASTATRLRRPSAWICSVSSIVLISSALTFLRVSMSTIPRSLSLAISTAFSRRSSAFFARSSLVVSLIFFWSSVAAFCR